MKYVIGFVFGTIAAMSLSAFAQNPLPTLPVETFINAGGKDSDGIGRMLKMTADGRVLAKCVDDPTRP